MTSTPSHDHVMPSRAPTPPPQAPPGTIEHAVRRAYTGDYLGDLTAEEVAAVAHLREWTHFGPICPICRPGRTS